MRKALPGQIGQLIDKVPEAEVEETGRSSGASTLGEAQCGE